MNSRLMRMIYLLISVFAAGALVATIITILFAPKSGRQMRKQIADQLKSFTDRQSEMMRGLTKRGLRVVKGKKEPLGWFGKWVA